MGIANNGVFIVKETQCNIYIVNSIYFYMKNKMKEYSTSTHLLYTLTHALVASTTKKRINIEYNATVRTFFDHFP